MQVEAMAQPGKGTAAGPIEGLPLSHHRFEALGQQSTDRPAFFRCQDARFAQEVSVEFQSDVSLHGRKLAQFYV
jgi:hypothetical protein